MSEVPMDRAEQMLADVCAAAFGDEERAALADFGGVVERITLLARRAEDAEQLQRELDEAESALADIAERVGAGVEDGASVDDYATAIDRALDRIGDEREAEAAAREPRPEDARDAARFVLRGGLATGDHELAIEMALRALEGR